MLSVSNCRTIRPRPAPTAARMAISRFRLVARINKRLATFEQAMEQNKADRTEKNPQRRACITDHKVSNGQDGESGLRVHDSGKPLA